MGRIKTLKDPKLRDRARRMRHENTDAEARIWGVLRDRRLDGWRWKRQAPCGRYIVDFLCPEAGLVVEVDGAQHARQDAYDRRRTADLIRTGLRVIRFWNSEVLTNLDGVCLTILDSLQTVEDRG